MRAASATLPACWNTSGTATKPRQMPLLHHKAAAIKGRRALRALAKALRTLGMGVSEQTTQM